MTHFAVFATQSETSFDVMKHWPVFATFHPPEQSENTISGRSQSSLFMRNGNVLVLIKSNFVFLMQLLVVP